MFNFVTIFHKSTFTWGLFLCWLCQEKLTSLWFPTSVYWMYIWKSDRLLNYHHIPAVIQKVQIQVTLSSKSIQFFTNYDENISNKFDVHELRVFFIQRRRNLNHLCYHKFVKLKFWMFCQSISKPHLLTIYYLPNKLLQQLFVCAILILDVYCPVQNSWGQHNICNKFTTIQ